MSVLSIVRALAGTVVLGDFTDAGRMVTPDPKEVAISLGTSGVIRLDLGSNQLVGAAFLGAVSSQTLDIEVRADTVTPPVAVMGNMVVANKRSPIPPFRYYVQFAPVAARYVDFVLNSGLYPAGMEIGNAIAGERFSPTWGHEWGAGRFLSDTSSVSRNRAGGFGIERGAVVPGWDFTLGDLTDEEREALFDMMRKVGESSPIIVAEDPTVSNDLDARLHYGLFRRLEKYERASVGVTRWSLKVEDWI